MVSEDVVGALLSALRDRRTFADAAQEELKKKDEYVNTYLGKIDALRNANEFRSVALRARIKRIGNLHGQLYSSATRRLVTEKVRQAFGKRALRSTTVVVYDPATQERRSGGRGKIVIGKFGIGVREHINARPIYGMHDVSYVLNCIDLMTPKMRELKLESEADALEALYAAIPKFSTEDGGIEVKLDEPVEFTDHNGRVGLAKAMLFERLWPYALYECKGFPSLQREMCDPAQGNGAYVVWVQLEKTIDRALVLAEERLKDEVVKRFGFKEEEFPRMLETGLTIEEVQRTSNIVLDGVEHALGRLLMISSL